MGPLKLSNDGREGLAVVGDAVAGIGSAADLELPHLLAKAVAHPPFFG